MGPRRGWNSKAISIDCLSPQTAEISTLLTCMSHQPAPFSVMRELNTRVFGETGSPILAASASLGALGLTVCPVALCRF